MKLLAGIYPPTSGRRKVTGQISSLFDIALGFESDANGWENIQYRGYLQGETPRSIRSKMQAIAEFSELGDFLNMPMRYYSAGMKVRLAFSIATAVDPEILIIDEVLSAGDMAFQAKARERMTVADEQRSGGDRRQPRFGVAAAVVRQDDVARPRQDADDRSDGGSDCGVYRNKSTAQRGSDISGVTRLSNRSTCGNIASGRRYGGQDGSCGSYTFHPFLPAATLSGRTSWCAPGSSGASSRCCG